MDNLSRAQTLIEALPYIRKFANKTIVIKYGGHAMAEQSLKEQFVLDIILMKYVGINTVIVHGGGPQISQIMDRMGIRPTFVDGQRITDDETMSVVEMVLVGTVNKEIVGLINSYKGRAVGLSGRDGDLIQADPMKIYKYTGDERPPEIIDIGRVGKVSSINAGILKALEDSGFMPVIAPVGVGPDGQAYNINADLVAGAIAGELKAEKLILLTDVSGVMSSKNELIPSMTADEARKALKDGTATGGMIPKLKSCLKALGSGVDKAHIIDGRKEHAILLELLTDTGVGTEIVQ
ncbi:MAG: acetylglutamate kinase [Deltaproteobacteria bacterium]|nr:acetylglutamate kinase [Deltaproteobacteria bacterium]MBW1932484.1 acetylglutamate kinase [Deltaproteobacteria bacterium]MBW1938860.1 acetylglutamate kinase [Deltaproteobacteria bacterium]MBW1963737.1 acetylglutamate kinase [Deltaproteobacteria bacterium]MBW2349895.1 acetylglutamate kinase [Deltaproteobacteria bacterium]